MFDSETAQLIRAAPSLRGVNADILPQELTRIYAELTALRLRADVLAQGEEQHDAIARLNLEAPDAALTVQFLAGTASTDEAPADTAQSLLGAGSSGMVAEQLGVGQRGAMAEAQEHESRFAFTPNFPAYPSGHATFGSACFNALRMIRDKPGQNADDIGDALRTFISDELTEIPQLPASESRQCAVPERWARLRALEPAPRSHRTAS